MKNLMMIAMMGVMGWAGSSLAGTVDPEGVIHPDKVCPDAAVCARAEQPEEPDRGWRRSTSCRDARKSLYRRGFHSINTERCGRSTYRFTAWRLGSIYRIKVSARTGRIISAQAFLLRGLPDQ